MPTLLVNLALDPARGDEVVRLLRTEMAPWMRRQEGFVSSRWFLSEDHAHCTITVEFAAEQHAQAVAEATRALPSHPARSWQVDRVEVASDLGLAPRPGLQLP